MNKLSIYNVQTHMHDDVSVNTGFFDQLQDNKDNAGSHAYHELAEAALKLQNKNPRSVRAIVYNTLRSNYYNIRLN